MAGEIAIHLATGLANTTAEIIPPDANYGWDGSQAVLWENLTLAQWQGGLVTITEAVLATGERTGLYKGDFPAASTLGKFGIRVRNTPSPTPASEVIAIGTIDWNGSREAAFPPNLEKLGINASGHVSRVTLVDTCTQNSDMRGTDGAATPADLGDLQTHGDSNWATATGFSTLTTADIDARLAAWGKTGFSLSATTGWGGTALPTSFSADNLPSKYPATLAATDVSGALPANVVQWNSGALPSIGTSNLTAQQVWEYANRTLTEMGFAVNLTAEARSALVAAIEVELANDETGEALMQAIADKLAAEFDLDELTVIAIRDAILNRVLAGNHDIPGSVGSQLQYLNAPIDSRAPASTALSNVMWTDNRAALLDKLGVPGVLAHTGNADLFKATGFATPADLSGLATASQLSTLQSHGDSNWATADTSNLATTTALDALQSHGDSAWTTATGFATSAALAAVGDKVEAILEDTSITGVVMAGYTAPDNEGIAAIKAQTDKLAFVGGDVKATLDGEKVAATLAAGDVTGNLPALVNGYAPSLEPVAPDNAAIAEAARDAILNRILAGNHDAAGTAGALLQKLDVGGDIANTSNADSFKATGFAVPGSAMTLTSGERNALADAVLSRDVANAESSAAEHSLCTIVLASLESSISGTTWTIKRTDGVTTHATKTLTTDETADPITGVS